MKTPLDVLAPKKRFGERLFALRRGLALCFLAGSLAAVTGSAQAAVWTGAAADGSYNTPGNWDNNDVPDSAGETANFTGAVQGAVTITGTVSPSSVAVTAGSYTFQGTGGIGVTATLTKTGSGTLTLANTNTYTGATTVSGGTLALDFTGATSPTTNIISSSSALVLSAGTLTLTGNANATNSQTFASTTINAGRSLVNVTANATANPLLLALGAITRNAGGTVIFTLPTGTQSATNGITTSSANTNAILGTWAIVNSAGTAANNAATGYTYATVSSNNITAYTAATGSTTFGYTSSATANYDVSAVGGPFGSTRLANTARYTGTAATLATNSPQTFTFNGLMNSGTGTLTLQTTAGSGNLLNVAVGSNGELVLAATNAGLFVNSIISGAAVTTTGPNTVTFAGANTYTGVTNIDGGILNIRSAAGLGTTAAGTTVTNGGTLQIQGAITTNAEALTLNGVGTSGQTGALVNVSGTNTYAGLLTLGGATTISSDTAGTSLNLTNAGTITGAGSDLTLAGVGNGSITSIIGTGTGGLIKNGTGTWTLTGANTYTGNTTVNAGTLTLNNATGNAIGGGNITIGDNSGTDTLLLGASNQIANSSGMTFNGGTFSTGAFSEGSVAGNVATAGLGALSLAANSTLNYGSGTNVLAYSNAGTFAAGTTLTVTNYTPGTDRLFIGNSNILTTTQLAQIQFVVGASTFAAQQDATSGEVTPFIPATNAYWTNAVGDNSWNTAGNWSLNADGTGARGVPDSLTDVIFSATTVATPQTTTLDASFSIRSLSFNATTPAVTINAGTGTNNLTIDTFGITMQSGAGAATINASSVALAAAQTWTNNSTTNLLTVSSPITGTPALTTAGAGTVVLTGTSTYTGSTTISAGTLQLGDGTTDGSITSSANIVDNATLVYNRVGTFTYANVISGTGAVTKTGAGTQILSGANTYTGITTINAGTLTASGGVAIADTGSVVLANVSGATFNLASSETIGALSGGGATGGNVTLGANTLTTASTTSTIYAGAISGTGGITKTGTGILTLSGASTYSGVTAVVGGGTLSVASINSATGGTASSNLGAPSSAANGVIALGGSAGSGTLLYTGTGETTDRGIGLTGGTVGGGLGIIDQSGTGLLKFTGNVTSGATITHTLQLQGSTAGAGEIAGVISDGALATSLIKSGNDSWTLSRTNTYTGGTTIGAGQGAGVLRATATQALGTSAGTITFDLGGNGSTTRLELTGGITLPNPIAFTARGNSSAAIENISGNNILSGLMTLGVGGASYTVQSDAGLLTLSNVGTTTVTAGKIVTFQGTGNILYAGILAGAGGLTKADAGTATLTGVNTYTGTTTINAGTLQLGNGTTDGNIATSAAIVDNGTLAYNRTSTASAFTYANIISGTGTVTKSGAGTQILTGANTYSGGTTVTGGVLGGTGALGGATTFAAGTTHSPGVSGPGIQAVNGNYSNAGTLALDLNGATAGSGYDQVNVTGTVTVTGSPLSLTSTGFTPSVGQVLVIVNNDDTDAVVGTFAGLTEGSTVTVGGTFYTISYVGGTGNDITLTPLASASSGALIGEFRAHGSGGALDEYIELSNSTTSPLSIGGWSVKYLSGGTLVTATVPANTTLVPLGHYLFTGSGYNATLSGISGSDQSLASPMDDATGITLLNAGSTVVDSVSFAGSSMAGEGTLLPSAPTADGEYAFERRQSSGNPAGVPLDNNNNSGDFIFVSTTGGTFASVTGDGTTATTLASTLGSPSPNSTTGYVQMGSVALSLLDTSVANTLSPNRVRLNAVDSGVVGAPDRFGTLRLRRTLTNNGSTTYTRVRFHVVTITTLNGGGYSDPNQADVRLLTSPDETGIATNAGAKNVIGTSVQAPATLAVGGGLNANTVVLNQALTPGSSANYSFELGVARKGNFLVGFTIELLP